MWLNWPFSPGIGIILVILVWVLAFSPVHSFSLTLEDAQYPEGHARIIWCMGCLFLLLCCGLVVLAPISSSYAEKNLWQAGTSLLPSHRKTPRVLVPLSWKSVPISQVIHVQSSHIKASKGYLNLFCWERVGDSQYAMSILSRNFWLRDTSDPSTYLHV